MSIYKLTFLNCTGVFTQDGLPHADFNTLTEQLASIGNDFQNIVASQERQAQLTAEAIQQSSGAELIIDPLWGSGSNHPADDWRVHIQAGKALQSLFNRPPGHYLVLSDQGFLSYIFSPILSEAPQGQSPAPPIYITTGTTFTLRYDLSDIKWNIQSLTQLEALGPATTADEFLFSLIRHGESMGNVQRVFQGQKDFPLSENGKKQAELLARNLNNGSNHYNKVIASPLTRTMQTAQSISSKLGLEIEVDDLWIEINNGKLAGKPGKSREENGRDRMFNPFEPVGEHGESWWDLYLRGGEALQTLRNNPPGNYLVVSHGGTLNAVMWNILGTPPQPGTLTHTIYFENTGMANIRFDPANHKWQLISLLPGAHP